MALDELLSDREVAEVLEALNGDGEETRIVGGAVRNALMGLPITEVDLASTALPNEVTRRAARAGFKAVPTGIEHGTVTLVLRGRPFEVTTLREDIETDGRRAVVRFGRSFVADALRRDFTINALSLDREGRVHDTVEGLADIEARRVRFIGDAKTRIKEDFLRILRFFRFHASYATGSLDAEGLAAAISLREGLRFLSAERIRNELLKLIRAPGAAATSQGMLAGGFWPLILGGVPHVSRFEAAIETQAAFPEMGDAMARLAALAVLTSEDATRIRQRLRLSNAEAASLTAIASVLERLHGVLSRVAVTQAKWEVARLVLERGARSVRIVLALEGALARSDRITELSRFANAVPSFPLSGSDLLKRGIPAGPEVGRLLALAREDWIREGCPLEKPALASILDRAAERKTHAMTGRPSTPL
ncbi:MAG: CCA tRNA nucleotidyltransferase [Hyphomicrobiales bacterium]|nr:CCA tRNA nucleotidyltransferase [Hyphomicrobiales bacterium]